MKSLHYIDTHSHHTMHEQFNASLLSMCASVYDRVEYRSGRSSRERVYELLERSSADQSNVHWKRTMVWGGGFSRTGNILRLLFSALQNIRIVLCAGSGNKLLFNYNNLFALFAINWLCLVFNRQVLIFCHGEMELILDKENWGGIFVRIQRKIAARFFLSSKRKSRIYFAVMGDSILSHIRQTVNPGLAERFISVDHSYIFGSTRPKTETGKPLQIGTVGVLTQAKGYDTLCALAERLQTVGGIKLSVTGRIFADPEPLERLGVDLPSNKGLLPLENDEFVQRIEHLDYILFLYPTESYKMIASGAVMNSVDKARPIVSLRNDYFSYLFCKYGQFGLLADDTAHLISIIGQLGRGDLPCPAIDFDLLRRKMSPEVLSTELKTALSTVNWL